MKPAKKQRFALHAVAVGAALCAMGAGQAAEIVTDNPDLAIRFDNTIKYNYANRVSSQNAAILKSVNNDDGDRNFNKGTVSSRADLLSEFDLVFQKRMGLRVSAAGWYDAAYSSLDNTNVATSNHLGADGKPALGLSRYASRYHKGASGEVLDAFVFGSFDIADMQLNVKLGQHTLYWGESVLSPIHGVNYGQSALDLIKAYSVPGSDAKELFLPRPALSAQFSPTPELSIAAQTFFNWKPARAPESGSFLGFYDYAFQGAESFNLSGLGLPSAVKAPDSTPHKSGDFGVSARWSPAWLDGTLGLYLRKTSDLLPQANLRLAGVPSALFGQSSPLVAANAQKAAAAVIAAGGTPAAAQAAAQQAGVATAQAVGNATCTAAIPGGAVAGGNCLFYPSTLGGTSQYQLEYGSNINVLGLSLSKSVAGISVGADLNYRRNMPLNSTPALLMPVGTNPALLASLNTLLKGQLVVNAAGLPAQGEVSGARGNTLHGVLNFIGSTAKTPLFDTSSWIAELTWNRVASVTQGAQFFKGRDNYTGIDKVGKDYFGLALNFSPTWFQVLPGIDLSMPLNYAVGLSGNSAVLSGGNKQAGNYSAGLSLDLYQKYRIDVKYVDFFGALAVDPASGAVSSSAGLMPLLKDRGFIAVTLKTTF
ncbi:MULTISPECIES: DUF1302 domain-containing protein [unclassified Duganella]|uniref:DUF1302 domain-containing protein n=1 Tax=unclassified Duganella TaxID=2636909 RepID=UPI000E353455|nr:MULTISPECIES: DUF1302 domain-containing protein [unclassified Duganella]RFP13655.1 DUF1302 domain-containing protein [Duganella sp. BJB475]RFP36363.1 DUF1302 domain-containing protein [Duganella sp. BJB476]